MEALETPGRVRSIDVLRGAIMVLMAIDHVRVYSGLPAGGPEVGIFFTRWVTHFCAPGFAFFAGTAAFLRGEKTDKRSLSKYLLTRGLMLVVLELTLIRFLWTFNLRLDEFMLAGVIWMLGWSMVIMAALVHLPAKVVGGVGLLIAFGQQLFGLVGSGLPEGVRRYWEFIYPTGYEGEPLMAILYVIVPWIGVMAAGYGFGLVLRMEDARMKRWCYMVGLGSILLFVGLGSWMALSGNSPTSEIPFIFRLLNQQKYPASQLYLLMTLGPLILLVPTAQKVSGWVARALDVFGRVPMFYYLSHILVIHLSAWIVNLILFGAIHQEWYETAPFARVPPENRWTLGWLYAVFIVDIAILYLLAKSYLERKTRT